MKAIGKIASKRIDEERCDGTRQQHQSCFKRRSTPYEMCIRDSVNTSSPKMSHCVTKRPIGICPPAKISNISGFCTAMVCMMFSYPPPAFMMPNPRNKALTIMTMLQMVSALSLIHI